MLKTPFHIVQVELGPGIVDNRGMALAQLCSPFSDVLHEASHLFKAAPDLLAACREAASELDDDAESTTETRRQCQARIEAAIARAKGDLRE